MVKHFINRKEIYHDEIRFENRFNQQRCVILKSEKKEGPLYEFNKIPRGRGLYEMGEKISDYSIATYWSYFIAYVDSDEKALEIASRWIQEDSQKEDNYSIHGIDHYYSVFD